MPCDDITEVIRIQFDATDRLVSYTLNKRSCGADIGQAALIGDLVRGLSAEEALALEAPVLFERYPILAEDEFLYFKHFVALQEGMATLIGRGSSSADAPCTPVTVSYDAEALEFVGLIRIEAMTEKIKACGNCKGCGKKAV